MKSEERENSEVCPYCTDKFIGEEAIKDTDNGPYNHNDAVAALLVAAKKMESEEREYDGQQQYPYCTEQFIHLPSSHI